MSSEGWEWLCREYASTTGRDAARATAGPRGSLFPGLDLFCIVRRATARAAFVLGDKVRPRMVLTPEDVELLKQLKAAGECGCNIRGFNTRVALQRLARGGYVVARAGVELVNYRITKRGEDAIAEHD